MKGYILIFIIIAFLACRVSKKATIHQPAAISIQGKLFAALYQQRAAEYYALCFQAYNIARLRVDEWQQHLKQESKPAAIVTDIDETVLDNSPYAAHRGLQGKDYEQNSWEVWTKMAKADTVPGSLSFLQYAASKGITIFYITNRNEKERTGTLSNLLHFNFPNADNAHLILRQNESSKEQRRQDVLKTHNILLLLGDNLTDFSALYDKAPSGKRITTTQQIAAAFGSKFIVLPNPSYGDWETSLYMYNYKFTDLQKDSIIKSELKTY